jgi:hypothetical protein
VNRIKPASGVLSVVIVCAALVYPQFASAETIYLHCNYDGGAFSDIAVDLTNSTLNGRPATITDLSIELGTDGPATGAPPGSTLSSRTKIDRTTGALTEYVTFCTSGECQTKTNSAHCEKTVPPAKKF